MLEDSYLCECNIAVAEKLKEQIWQTIFIDVEKHTRVFAEAVRIARYNNVIIYNFIMMLTHGDFNYAE